MPKNILQDIKPLTRTNNRIPKQESTLDSYPTEPQERNDDHDTSTGYEYKEPHSNHTIWLLAVVSILVLLFALSFLFVRATVTIVPKNEKGTIDDTLLASKDGKTGDILFDTMSVDGQESITVEGVMSKNVMTKASGQVIIYNAYSSSSQKLVVNTRLEAPNGHIYRIVTGVTIPGQRTVSGKVVPGSVEVTAVAAEAGDTYNSGPVDFTIPGFKGSPQYSKIYARSKGSMSGGAQGTVYVVAPDDVKKAQNDLLKVLVDKLLKQVQAQVPKGYILYPDDTIFIQDPNLSSAGQAQTAQVPIEMKGTLYAFLFPEIGLSDAIVKKVISQRDPTETIEVKNLHDLKISIKDIETIDPRDINQITLKLSGSPFVVWGIDQQPIKEALLNKKKSEFNQILSAFPTVDSASLTIRPFWVRTVPKNAKDVKIVVEDPQ